MILLLDQCLWSHRSASSCACIIDWLTPTQKHSRFKISTEEADVQALEQYCGPADGRYPFMGLAMLESEDQFTPQAEVWAQAGPDIGLTQINVPLPPEACNEPETCRRPVPGVL